MTESHAFHPVDMCDYCTCEEPAHGADEEDNDCSSCGDCPGYEEPSNPECETCGLIEEEHA